MLMVPQCVWFGFSGVVSDLCLKAIHWCWRLKTQLQRDSMLVYFISKCQLFSNGNLINK